MLNYLPDEIPDPFTRRLAEEHMLIHQLAEANPDLLDYEEMLFSKIAPSPPVEYRIIYKVRSYKGIQEDESPVEGERFEMSLRLPANYPEQPAECRMISDVWHPNIRFDGPFKGQICTNHSGFGSLFKLDELIIRIGEFLQYKRYLAEEVKPFPEDARVARWVREYAEPKRLVLRSESICLDERPWHRERAVSQDGEIKFLD